MINTNNGKLHLKGTGFDILADLSTIVHGLYEHLQNEMGGSKEEAKERIMEAVEKGLMSEEELLQLLKTDLDKLFESMADSILGKSNK